MEETNNLPVQKYLDEANLDRVLELITLGTHYKDIAEEFKTNISAVFRYLSDPKYSARVIEAREFAAHVLVDEAERVLAQAKDQPYQFYLIAKDLAHHYRWKASMIYGRQYASKKVVIDPKEQEKKELIIRVVRDGAINK